MNRIGRLCAWIAVALGCASRLSAAAPRPDVVTLTADAVIERHADSARVHRYQVSLAAGDSLRVTVDQRGLDVIVDIYDPAHEASNTPLAVFQEAVGYRGEEQADLVAPDTPSTYTIAVRWAAADRNLPDASYAIHLGPRHAATASDRTVWKSRLLRATARDLVEQRRNQEAIPLFERAAQLAEGVRGSDDPYVALVWFDAANAAATGLGSSVMVNAAVADYQRAVAVLDKALGADHPYPAWVRACFAYLELRTGQYRDAELLLEPAVPILEKTLGSEHEWFLRSLVTTGSLRSEQLQFEQAEAADARVLAILEQTQRTGTPMYAEVLRNLGEVYRQTHDYTKAAAYYRRALAAFDVLSGPESRDVALALQNLGLISELQKNYAEAMSYDMRALAMKEHLYGSDHAQVGQVLNNIALVYHRIGDDAKALETYNRALAIFEKGGPSQHNTMVTVGNIERLYAAAGDVTNALAYQHRVEAIIERQVQLHLTIGSEQQKLEFVSSIAERTDRTISLHLDQAPSNPDAAGLAALVVLQRKGRVLDAMTDTLGIVRQRIEDTGDRTLLSRVDQLKAATARLAWAVLNSAEDTTAADRERQIRELRKRIDQLEADLNLHGSDHTDTHTQPRPITVDEIQAAIPDEAALLEFAVFRPFYPKADRDEDSYGPPHYAVYVLRKIGPPQGFDLGPTQAINQLIAQWRESLRDPDRRDYTARARFVDVRVMEPLRQAIGTATRLLISPDGDLNLAPFEALLDEQRHYLVERYAISYLTSGRDLIRMQETRASRGAPVIVADPLFGEPKPVIVTASTSPSPLPKVGPRSVTSADDLSTMYFAPLVASAAEARAIKALFPESTLLLGRRATKEALQELQAPRVLHIASHGFFLQETSAIHVENPLLRSGVALAGANMRRQVQDAADDGIMTALEASSLNLWGTKLVTLSGCDTGIGEVRNGEGVYGMRRAFVLAGAETLVMSLWPVFDSIARETMTDYYTGLRAGLGRGEALRQAKLEMLKRPTRRHPFYWASFIQSGEWANLDGQR